ncbi:hypothetical protein MKX03_026110, partial [Papaver bracteatum]
TTTKRYSCLLQKLLSGNLVHEAVYRGCKEQFHMFWTFCGHGYHLQMMVIPSS